MRDIRVVLSGDSYGCPVLGCSAVEVDD